MFCVHARNFHNTYAFTWWSHNNIIVISCRRVWCDVMYFIRGRFRSCHPLEPRVRALHDANVNRNLTRLIRILTSCRYTACTQYFIPSPLAEWCECHRICDRIYTVSDKFVIRIYPYKIVLTYKTQFWHMICIYIYIYIVLFCVFFSKFVRRIHRFTWLVYGGPYASAEFFLRKIKFNLQLLPRECDNHYKMYTIIQISVHLHVCFWNALQVINVFQV